MIWDYTRIKNGIDNYTDNVKKIDLPLPKLRSVKTDYNDQTSAGIKPHAK